MISLLPAFEHLTFIAIHQTGAVPTVLGLRICAMREPISNGSFAHGNLYGNITCPQSLTMKRQDLFVPLLPRALGEVQAADPTVASSLGLLVCARLDTGLRPPRGSRLNSSQDATDQRLGPPEEPLEALLQQTRGSGRG